MGSYRQNGVVVVTHELSVPLRPLDDWAQRLVGKGRDFVAAFCREEGRLLVRRAVSGAGRFLPVLDADQRVLVDGALKLFAARVSCKDGRPRLSFKAKCRGGAEDLQKDRRRERRERGRASWRKWRDANPEAWEAVKEKSRQAQLARSVESRQAANRLGRERMSAARRDELARQSRVRGQAQRLTSAIARRLRRLDELLAMGAITQDEHAMQRARILAAL